MPLSDFTKRVQAVIKRDDIRGVYGTNIDTEFAYNLGRVLAATYRRCTAVEPVNVTVAHDMRLSGAALAAALCRGLDDGGARAILVGRAGTELAGFLPAKYSDVIDGGVMITASHNPKDNNGFKFFGRAGLPFPLAVNTPGPCPEDELKRLTLGLKKRAIPTRLAWEDFGPDYILTALERGACDFESIPSGDRPLRIAVEAGNGMGAQILKEFSSRAPQFEWFFADDVPDGAFPRIVPNPLNSDYQQMLRELVLSTQSDVGICFDGDADRVALMDEKGEMLGPPLMATLIGQKLRSKMGQDQKIAFNLASSWVVADTLGDRGTVLDGPALITPVGYGKIKVIMNGDEQIAFGAEHSGHYVFREFWGADSGMLAGLLMLELVAELHAEGKAFSSILEEPRSRYFESGEINFQMPAERPGEVVIAEAVEKLRDEIEHLYVVVDDRVREVDSYPPKGLKLSVDDVRAEAGDWWFCMRKSGTEGGGGGILRIYVESDADQALMESKRDELVELAGPELRMEH